MQDLPIHGHKGHGVVALQLIPAVEIHWPSTLACAPVPTAGLNAKDKFYVLMQVGGPVIPSLRMLGLARACMQIKDLGEKLDESRKLLITTTSKNSMVQERILRVLQKSSSFPKYAVHKIRLRQRLRESDLHEWITSSKSSQDP